MTTIKVHIPDAHIPTNPRPSAKNGNGGNSSSSGNGGHQNPGSSPNGGGGEMG